MAGRQYATRVQDATLMIAILCLLGTFLLAGCPGRPDPGPASASAKPVVVTSIYPLADWVRQVAGDSVEVYVLLPTGASPHTYEPVPADAARAAHASLLVVVGLGLDDWARKLSVGPQTRTLVLGTTVQPLPNVNPDEPDEVGGADPHVWMDPDRAAQMVAVLTEALVTLLPASRAQLEQRSAAYQAELRGLAAEMAQRCRPYAGRRTVTMHAGYDYLLARCGLPPAEVITPFPGKEPSAQYLETIARRARQEGLKVLYAEPQLSPKTAEVLAGEIGGQVLTLDSLGNPDLPTRNTYMKLVRFDVDQLLQGFKEP